MRSNLMSHLVLLAVATVLAACSGSSGGTPAALPDAQGADLPISNCAGKAPSAGAAAYAAECKGNSGCKSIEAAGCGCHCSLCDGETCLLAGCSDAPGCQDAGASDAADTTPDGAADVGSGGADVAAGDASSDTLADTDADTPGDAISDATACVGTPSQLQHKDCAANLGCTTMPEQKCACFCGLCSNKDCMQVICDDSCMDQDVQADAPDTALPPGKCTNDAPCKDGPGFYCLQPGAFGGCGMCMKPEMANTCEDDAACAAVPNGICVQKASDCLCSPAKVCHEGCAIDSACAQGEVCGADHHCGPKSCAAASDCPAQFGCDAGSCVRKTCAAGSACPGGYCVVGQCFDEPGTCDLPKP